MGRTKPSHAPMAQQGFRKDQRAKTARTTINKIIPQILASDARARAGIENAYLFTNAKMGIEAASHIGPNKTNVKAQQPGRGKTLQSVDMNVNQEQPRRSQDLSKTESVPFKISVQVTDTLTAAYCLHQAKRSRRNVGILNMASPLRPGGGVLNGATSQEESICARTTLLPSLREEWYRLPEVGGIWSPDVLVFRLPRTKDEEDLSKADRFYVDVVSAAMTRFPDTIKRSMVREASRDSDDDVSDCDTAAVEKMYASQKDRDLALEKMRTVLQVFKSHKTEYVVLGAWGCGAYGNPVSEICAAWKKALLGTRSCSTTETTQSASLGSIKEIVFAIKDANMAEAFARYWGDGMEITVVETQAPDVSDTAADERHVEELRTKIDALELQIEEAKTPLLQKGLQSAMHVLKLQLDRLTQRSSENDVGSEDQN
ncbi:uncharacterized protein PV09_05077 [Verruconis gallopava]|uniref:Microbial-type PARG catalytic domain-containing protein n=1 Tax=Verruconis gallopava TaxID=253628 RepID=A0A0D2AX57_9PEZI|nr:uncharacterized protein PV09_05077 [Verruconis gallopava]KIW03774.1 hypothetical protein PV09_05077 [Verruconis gallopava]